MQASTVARDIFYFGNLDLDEKIVTHVRFRWLAEQKDAAPRALIHTTMIEAGSERRLAEVFTLKELL